MPTSRHLALLMALAIGVPALAHAQTATPDPADAAAIGSSLSPVFLRGLPASDNVYSLLETVEGEVISDGFYGGGLNTGRQARDGAFLNSWSQTQFFVGDVNVTVPNGGTPFLFPTVAPWDRVDIGSALMPVSVNAPGLAVSFQPARPASTWTGSLDASGAGSNFVAPARSGPPAVESLRQWTHGGLFVSGPLSPRVGMTADIEWSGAKQVERGGTSQADGRLASGLVHIVFTPNVTDEVRTVGWVQRTQSPFASAAAFAAPLAADQTTFTHVQSTWERRGQGGSSRRLFAAYSEADASRDGTLPSAVSIERLLDGPVPTLVDSGDRTDSQWTLGARSSTAPRVVGHVLSAGVDVSRASARIGPGYIGAITEQVDGKPARVWQYTNSRIDGHRHATMVNAFISDRVGLGQDRFLEAGIAYDGVDGAADGATTGISWRSVLPRVSVRWKQGEASHFTWLAGYRRTADRLTLDTLDVGDPAAPTASVSKWSANGLGPVVERIGPGTGGDPSFSAIDPSLARPTMDEVSAGVEIRLTPNIRGRITGVAKEIHHLFNLVDTGAPLSSYSTFTVIDGRPAEFGGDTPLTLYNRLPSTFGADKFLLTNSASGLDTARAAALVLNSEATLSRLTLMLNATASITDGPAMSRGFHLEENNLGALGELAIDPNAAGNARGRFFFDRALTAKLSAVYRFPGDVALGAIARYQDGQPFARVTVVPGSTDSRDLNQGIEFVRALPQGESRFTFTGTLDLRLQKRVAFDGKSVVLFVDGYNIANMHYEVEERVVTGPGYRDPTAIQPPLSVHVGVRLNF